jgi:hypothetical protein
MKPTGGVQTKYVELTGTVQVVTFKYKGTQADEIINKPEMRDEVPSSSKGAETNKVKGKK